MPDGDEIVPDDDDDDDDVVLSLFRLAIVPSVIVLFVLDIVFVSINPSFCERCICCLLRRNNAKCVNARLPPIKSG